MERQWNGFRLVGAVEDDTAPIKSKNLAASMQELLSDVSLFYHTVHEFHWNVSGSDFYEYHKFFDEIVSDVYDSIDPIAENIRKLGNRPQYKMSELLNSANLKEHKIANNSANELTLALIELNTKLIDVIKKTFNIANSENEQGIANFLAERIDMHQKWNWFLKSSVE